MSSSETQPGAAALPSVGEAVSSPKGGANGGDVIRLDPNNTPSAAGSSTPGNIVNPPLACRPNSAPSFQGPAITRNNYNPIDNIKVKGGLDVEIPGYDDGDGD